MRGGCPGGTGSCPSSSTWWSRSVWIPRAWPWRWGRHSIRRTSGGCPVGGQPCGRPSVPRPRRARAAGAQARRERRRRKDQARVLPGQHPALCSQAATAAARERIRSSDSAGRYGADVIQPSPDNATAGTARAPIRSLTNRRHPDWASARCTPKAPTEQGNGEPPLEYQRPTTGAGRSQVLVTGRARPSSAASMRVSMTSRTCAASSAEARCGRPVSRASARSASPAPRPVSA